MAGMPLAWLVGNYALERDLFGSRFDFGLVPGDGRELVGPVQGSN